MLKSDARVLSYVVARDYGFAPNPFFGICTLGTCKPDIRRTAKLGDWVVGIGSARYHLAGRLVYAMEVGEALTFEEYWADPQFKLKRPDFHGSLKRAFGDNIYYRDRKTKEWRQENSHHSLANGRPNKKNIDHDTQANRVLIGPWFVYLGKDARPIPAVIRAGLCGQRPGYGVLEEAALVTETIQWVRSLGMEGLVGEPAEFEREISKTMRATGRAAQASNRRSTRNTAKGRLHRGVRGKA